MINAYTLGKRPLEIELILRRRINVFRTNFLLIIQLKMIYFFMFGKIKKNGVYPSKEVMILV